MVEKLRNDHTADPGPQRASRTAPPPTTAPSAPTDSQLLTLSPK